jgi:hypothetical protein
VLVIDGRCIILAVSGALGVVVLFLNVLLTHKENVKIKKLNNVKIEN